MQYEVGEFLGKRHDFNGQVRKARASIPVMSRCLTTVNLGWAHFCKTRKGLNPRFECVILKKSCKTVVLMCCVVVLVQRKQLLSGTPRKYSLPARRSWTPSPLQVQNETWTIRDIRQENDGHMWKLYWYQHSR